MKKLALYFLILIAGVILLQSCQKEILSPKTNGISHDISIEEAKAFFEKKISGSYTRQKRTTSSLSGHNHDHLDANSIFDNKQALWERASLKLISTGQSVKIPLDFGHVYWQVNSKSKALMPFSSLNYLFMYKDTSQNIHSEVVTLIPDSSWLYGNRDRYTGKIVVRDWNGKLIKVLKYNASNKKAEKRDRSMSIRRTSNADNPEDEDDEDSDDGLPPICILVQDWASCTCSNKYNCDYCVQCTMLVCGWPQTPDNPPIDNENGGGSNHGGGGGGGASGSGPNAGDYSPGCNPDPNYSVPTTPPPAGTDWILPCGNDIPEPVDPPDGGTEEPQDDEPIAADYVIPETINISYTQDWFDTEDFLGLLAGELSVHGITHTDPIPEMYYKNGIAIDMNPAPALSRTITGVPRNQNYFWKQLVAEKPEMFSLSNLNLIKNNTAPIIDAKWILYNPTHKSYLNTKLVHHHENQGRYAYAIPERVHRKWSSILHTVKTQGKVSNITGKLNSLAGALQIFSMLTDLHTGNPDAWINWFGPQNVIGQIYKDNAKDVYFEITSKVETKNSAGNVVSAVVSYTVYSDYIWDSDEGKYMGVLKLGKFTENIDVLSLTSKGRTFIIN